jgi:hypothetical protein
VATSTFDRRSLRMSYSFTAKDSSHHSCKHTLPTPVMAHKTYHFEELKHTIMMNIIIIKISKVGPLVDLLWSHLSKSFFEGFARFLIPVILLMPQFFLCVLKLPFYIYLHVNLISF